MISRIAYSGYAAVKHQVDRFDRWPLWQGIRRGIKEPFFRCSDTGLFGLTPLKMHILICGFPASGTTLLQLMIENGLPAARRFGKERSGWKAATYSVRNHEVMISKQPRDILHLERLQEFYKHRTAKLKTILMLRDPRDLLTTQRARQGVLSYGSPQEWRTYLQAYLKHCDCTDTLVVRYEDLVSNVLCEQSRVENFVEQRMAVDFEDFIKVDRKDFDTTTLRGLRPLDRSRMAKWKGAAHHQRMCELLKVLPELPQVLQQLGYEKDSAWTREYIAVPAMV